MKQMQGKIKRKSELAINVTELTKGCLSLDAGPYVFAEKKEQILTLVLLNPDRSCLCKQCRSRSVGF